jgi:hypothetical protein
LADFTLCKTNAEGSYHATVNDKLKANILKTFAATQEHRFHQATLTLPAHCEPFSDQRSIRAERQNCRGTPTASRPSSKEGKWTTMPQTMSVAEQI